MKFLFGQVLDLLRHDGLFALPRRAGVAGAVAGKVDEGAVSLADLAGELIQCLADTLKCECLVLLDRDVGVRNVHRARDFSHICDISFDAEEGFALIG